MDQEFCLYGIFWAIENILQASVTYTVWLKNLKRGITNEKLPRK